jgi:hypothetical protein
MVNSNHGLALNWITPKYTIIKYSIFSYHPCVFFKFSGGGNSDIFEGKFSDISGIAYCTETQLGVINADGAFKFKTGETYALQ